jgi:hypothetical protein
MKMSIDERNEVLSWYSNQLIQRWSICLSVQIHQGAFEEVQLSAL